MRRQEYLAADCPWEVEDATNKLFQKGGTPPKTLLA